MSRKITSITERDELHYTVKFSDGSTLIQKKTLINRVYPEEVKKYIKKK